MTQQDALSILKTGAHVFLTGSPGSGKTHTVNEYISWLRSHSIEPSITASTGIAATHVGGMTLHAWSGIGIADHMTPQLLDAIAHKEHVAKRIQKAKVLIIDEVSMLSGNVLSMVDEVTREVRQEPDLSFGGLQVVLVGDFFQLPPIGRGETEFAFESTAWRSLNPLICYLTEQHRQDDLGFLEILNAIRDGDWDHTHVSRIMARESEYDSYDENTPQLFTHNADVDRINRERLEGLSGKMYQFPMESSGSQTLAQALIRGCLSPEQLLLKEGAIVMATKNNPAAGYSNGTLGTVIGFEVGTGYPIIETHDEREITIAPADWAVEENGKVKAKISQIPLRLAWAITVHKSQGMSMDAAAIDLSRAFEHGQGYVALSRVRRLDGVFLLGWSEQALSVHPRVAERDRDFQEASEAAAATFAGLDAAGDRELMEQNFIKKSGGSLKKVTVTEKKKAPKRSTHDETLALLIDGMPLTEIALERSLTLGTISDHAAKLLETNRITEDTLLELIPERLQDGLPAIYEAFSKKGSDKLAPVRTALKNKFSYDDLTLARALFHKQQ
ncbi:AAA family ATPase [Patescibacteria group bacterium]|nr:AAA family ATPase [Patescibacteria group bacterium]MBU2159198.1 AAA family ATPase [Patescibacteria group bacterium]MBU2220953.1 AAA family ATPase [Patescibacteria group bacterium]